MHSPDRNRLANARPTRHVAWHIASHQNFGHASRREWMTCLFNQKPHAIQRRRWYLNAVDTHRAGHDALHSAR